MINLLYTAVVMVGISTAIEMLARKGMGIKFGSLSQFDPIEIGKASTVLAVSLAIHGILIKQGLIPEDIIK